MLPRARALLRSPRTIFAEGAAVAIAGVVSTLVPQSPTPSERVGWALDHPLLAPAAAALRLHSVFTSWWFLGLLAVAAASLAVVLVEQWTGLLRARRRATEASFGTAPLRARFERPARGAATRIVSRHGPGVAGSPLFHLGLMIVILAGLARMLYGAEAVVHAYEGERLEPGPSAFGAQWLGPLARPIALDVPVVVRELIPDRYPSGGLARLRARLGVESVPPRELVLAVNAPVEVGRERLHLFALHGCAAFVELETQGATERRILFLDEVRDGEYVRTELLPGGIVLRLRAVAGPGGGRPAELEVRALRDNALVAVAMLRPGGALALPGGRVAVADLRFWVRLLASRDLSAWPAYLGFVLVLVGAVLMLALIPVDEAVIVERDGDRERVTVALRPRRLAPLFRERLERLVRDEGGPGPA